MMLLHLLFLFTVVDVFQSGQPQFKGGQGNLNSFISNNLIYPEYSKQNCLQGTVNISFKLNNQGRIFHSEIQKGFGTDLDAEALRIVRLSSGRWVIPSGYDTTNVLVLPVNFSLKGFNCEQRNRDELNAAIAAYQARKDLTKAIFNFYDKKAAGEYNAQDEARIQILKSQLGYDERYIGRLLKQALRKLKQGDKESGCDDLNTVRRLGSDIADKNIQENCR